MCVNFPLSFFGKKKYSYKYIRLGFIKYWCMIKLRKKTIKVIYSNPLLLRSNNQNRTKSKHHTRWRPAACFNIFVKRIYIYIYILVMADYMCTILYTYIYMYVCMHIAQSDSEPLEVFRLWWAFGCNNVCCILVAWSTWLHL